MNPSPAHRAAYDANIHHAEVSCPKCGLTTHQEPVAIYRGRRHGQQKLAAIIAPFIKSAVMHGHACGYCKHLFYISNRRMPALYYAWLGLLFTLTSVVAWIAYLALVGA